MLARLYRREQERDIDELTQRMTQTTCDHCGHTFEDGELKQVQMLPRPDMLIAASRVLCLPCVRALTPQAGTQTEEWNSFQGTW